MAFEKKNAWAKGIYTMPSTQVEGGTYTVFTIPAADVTLLLNQLAEAHSQGKDAKVEITTTPKASPKTGKTFIAGTIKAKPADPYDPSAPKGGSGGDYVKTPAFKKRSTGEVTQATKDKVAALRAKQTATVEE